MHASAPAGGMARLPAASCCVVDMNRDGSSRPSGEDSQDVETKRAIRDLLDVLPKDILDELNAGAIDLKDAAFLDGLVDHISRLSLASPRAGQKILPKVLKLKKLISRSLRESDPEVQVSATVTRTTARVGRNDACPCGSGKKYKQCCLRKGQQT
jgi:hypothetical protein